MNEKKPQNNRLLYQYAGFAFQLLVLLGIAIYAGLKFDGWINPPIPVFVWLLPLLVIIFTIVKAVKDTSK
ncbi:MAG TPA: hypothetical protein VHB48_19030 [Chitinophagaceae bacterium]|jgi:hypothetical protein|nr:hypothetical protein [Chitinophagaceae bacterium]